MENPEINPWTYGQLIYDKSGKTKQWNNGGKIVSSINGAGKTRQLYVKKMKLEHSLAAYTKISSKWIKGLNVRWDTIKLLRAPMDDSCQCMAKTTTIL